MSKPLTKSELIADIAYRAEMSVSNATAALHAVISSVSAQLAEGNTVLLPGLAKFEPHDSTGEMIEKVADRGVKVSALRETKAAVYSDGAR